MFQERGHKIIPSASPGRVGELVLTEMPSCRAQVATSGTRLSLIPGEKGMRESEDGHMSRVVQ